MYKLNLKKDISEKALKFNNKTNTTRQFKTLGYPSTCHFTDLNGDKILVTQKSGGRISASRRTNGRWSVIKFETALNDINWNQPMTDVRNNVYEV